MAGLNLPDVAHRRFENAPLKSMLGQIRFAPILRVGELAFIAPFQEAVRADYPELQREDEVGLMVSPEGAFKTDASRRWRLVGRAGWAIVLAPEFITLQAEADQYTDYEEFRRRFADVWSAVVEYLMPTHTTQQGLRYINHIEKDIPPGGWRSIINPELLGPIGSESLGDELKEAICDLRLRRLDGELTMKHGIVRAGPERRLGYLLDFDYFTQDVSEDLTQETVLARFDAFHGVIYRLFRWSLTEEGTMEIMGRRREASRG